MAERRRSTRPTRVEVRDRVKLPTSAPSLDKPQLDYVGRSVPRVDAPGKVTGQTRYVEDYHEVGVLVGRVLRAAHPHARVLRIDTSRAKNVPGVHAVLTHEDVPGRKTFGVHVKDQPLLVGDRVRYWGDAIAMVAAESDEAATRALDLIEVEYEPLPVIGDTAEALKPGQRAIHGESNLGFTYKVRKGDTEAGFAAAVVIVEQSYRVPYVDHVPIEPMAALAVPRSDGGITVHCPTQLPHTANHDVAAILGISPGLVNLEFAMMGGGFGGKEDPGIDVSCRAALLTLRTGRPVKVVYSREEHMRVSPKRHPMTMICRTGATRDGRLVAAEVAIYSELGAYESGSHAVSLKASTHAVGPYVIPNVKIDLYAVYTNNPPTGAMRALGAPQVTFAYEQQMDELAERLGIDPVDFRLRNGLRPGDSTATQQVLDFSVGLTETIERTVEQSKFRSKWRGWKPAARDGRIARGIGIATSYFGLGRGSGREAGTVVVRATEDGRIAFDSGVGDLGQGSFTALAQIAAEALDVPTNLIHIPKPDTSRSPEYGTTSGSRATTVAGNGIVVAAIEAQRVLRESVTARFGGDASEVDWRQGAITVGRETISVRDLVKQLYQEGEVVITRTRWVPPEHVYDNELGKGEPYFIYAFATAVAEVSVDLQTGETTVDRITIAQDVGKAINPQNVAGQIEGGVHMGVGYALMEEQPWVDGKSVAVNLHNYTVPTTLDTPPIDVIIVEEPSPFGPFGAKGVGEPPVNPVAPAIANAVYNATGVRVRDLPITGEKVLRGFVANDPGRKATPSA